MPDFKPPPEFCPRCGAEFHCGRNDEADCWCAGLPPLTPVAGRSCLCRRCLAEELREQLTRRT